MKIGKLVSFEKTIGAVIFRREVDRTFFLLVYSGYWGLPKGHPEEDENEKQTLKREVQEETGIDDLKILEGFRESFWFSYKPGAQERQKRNFRWIVKKFVHYLAQTQSEEVLLSEEHSDHVWLEFDEALKKITHTSARRVLQKAGKFLKDFD